MHRNKKQQFANACGAASLLCAAAELGVQQLPDLPSAGCMGQTLEMNNNCEAAIYFITSGASTGSRPVGMNLERSGYSMPHNLILAARVLGLKGTIYMPRSFYSISLGILYPKIEALCKGAAIPVHCIPCPPLKPDQRVLKILSVLKIAGLHYVMLRPDNTYMDPADGITYTDFSSMNNSWLKSYTDTSICILLERS